jgi:hypothetical protein
MRRVFIGYNFFHSVVFISDSSAGIRSHQQCRSQRARPITTSHAKPSISIINIGLPK